MQYVNAFLLTVGSILQEATLPPSTVRQPDTQDYPYQVRIAEDYPILNLEQKIIELCEGAKSAEQLFGFETNSMVKRITLHTQTRYFGVAAYAMPDAMIFNHYLMGSNQELFYWSFHETVHLIDDATGRKLSAGKLAELHTEIANSSPQFFDALKEHNFLPSLNKIYLANKNSLAKLGHPESDQLELLASLVNSLNHPNLELALTSATPEFRHFYKECLQALSENLVNQAQIIPKTAPLHERIKEVLGLL